METRRKLTIRKRNQGMRNAPIWVVAFVVGTFGAIEYYNPQNIQLRANKAEIQALEDQTEMERLKAAMEAEEANRRYASGCSMIFDPNSYNSATGYYTKVITLSGGMPILSSETGNPLAEGALVCDSAYNTFVIRAGVTADYKRADNSELVNQRFDDYVGWNSRAERGSIVVGN